MDIVLIIIGAVLMLVGLAGCIVPVIPGPPISYVGLLMLHFTEKYELSTSNENFLMIWFFIVALVTVLDYVVPIYGTKKFGGTKKGVWGSTIGLLIGLVFAPLGFVSIIIGPFLGAYIGEMMAQNDSPKAIKAAFGSFIGFLTGTLMKFAVSLILIFYFVKTLI